VEVPRSVPGAAAGCDSRGRSQTKSIALDAEEVVYEDMGAPGSVFRENPGKLQRSCLLSPSIGS
jgi:hypothetical protein